MGEIKDYKSFEAFLIGPISFLGGGLFEFLVWTANIWFFIAVIFFYKRNFSIALILATIAFLIAGTFFFWKEILAAENGRMGRIYSLEPGYFLWITSTLFLIVGSFYLIIKSKLTSNKMSF
ncbi:Transmembrane protein [Chryseobacterium sp. IT-36CA2]